MIPPAALRFGEMECGHLDEIMGKRKIGCFVMPGIWVGVLSGLNPAPAIADFGVLKTAFGRYLKDMIQSGPVALQLTGPFSKVSHIW